MGPGRVVRDSVWLEVQAEPVPVVVDEEVVAVSVTAATGNVANVTVSIEAHVAHVVHREMVATMVQVVAVTEEVLAVDAAEALGLELVVPECGIRTVDHD